MRAVGYQHPASLDHPQHSLDSQELPDPQDLLNSQHLADPEYQLSPEYLVDPKYLVDPEYLVDIELPDPSPGADDLLVRVEAVAVNPVDVKVRRRELPPPGAWRLLGWDAVGRVEALGQRAGGFAVGDRVWYAGPLNRAGCNAELQLVDWRLVARAPQSLTSAEAAALPLTSLTAWELLFDRLRLPQGSDAAAGQVLLVVAGAGGVGSMVLQLARQLTGLTLVATASQPEGQAWARHCGAHQVIDHKLPLRTQLAALGIEAVQWVASLSHTDQHFDALVDLLAPQGALALIDDPNPAAINLLSLKRKSLSLHWELMFTRSLFQTADMAAQGGILQRVAELVDENRLFSSCRQILGPINAANLTAAHRQLAGQLAGQSSIGKIVLEGWD
ncbi:MAG TPA: zinc-binding alcohol dehydrogenase family protein [Synechococcales bacterium UBA10510]|nr:zinc-binding alcohol dehydrogenase family protein [Synechococcales bacterium UBA10510]